MATASVFQCYQDQPDDRQFYARPKDDAQRPQDDLNRKIVWGSHEADPAQWTPWEFMVTRWAETDEHVPVTNWDGSCDFFRYDGGCGIWSQRAMDTIRLCLGDRFIPLPMTVNSRPYFILAPLRKLEVLDMASVEKSNAEGRWPPVYSFAKDQIPELCLFLTPDMGTSLFFSESAMKRVKAAGLLGIGFFRVDE